MTGIRVAAVQFAVGSDVDANLAACVRMVNAAAARGAHLIVLPAYCNHPVDYTDRTLRFQATHDVVGIERRFREKRIVRHQRFRHHFLRIFQMSIVPVAGVFASNSRQVGTDTF